MLLRNKTVLWRELDGEVILLDPKQGCSYNLNQVGTLIWKMLDGQHTTADIVEAICEAFEVEPELALQDLKLLLDELRSNNLLSNGISPSHPGE